MVTVAEFIESLDLTSNKKDDLRQYLQNLQVPLSDNRQAAVLQALFEAEGLPAAFLPYDRAKVFGALKNFDRAGEASTSENWGYPVGLPSSEGLPGNFKELQSRPVGPLFLTHRPASAQVELCDVASSFFDNEADRQVAVTQVLTQYLHCDYKRLKIATGKAGQPPQTDGTATVMRDGEEFPYQWGEFKLEVGQGGADPQAESVLYFFHFISRTKARRQRMLPGLMLEQFGAYIRISGIANVGEHVACEPLTPALYLLDMRPHQPEYMEQLAQTLQALRLTAQYYRIGYEIGSLPKLEASPLPYVLRHSRNAVLHGQETGHDVLSRAELTSGALQLWKDRLLTPYMRQPDSDQLEESAGQTATADDTRSVSMSAPAADVHSLAAAQPGSSSAEEDSAEADLSGGSPGPTSDPASSLPLAGAVKVQPGCEVPTKLLYKVSEPGSPDAVHKFTTRYSAEAHSALAAQHLAPELLAPVESLPGGWFWVRMRLLDSPWRSLLCILQSGDLEQIRAAVAAAQVALSRAHEIRLGGNKLVWGDARSSNFMLRWLDDGTIDVRLIDFDWSGAEGAVAYPGYLNRQVPWARGVRSHDPIVQTHDVELLRKSVCKELVERFGYVPDVMDSGAAAANSSAAASDSANAQAEKPGSPGSRVSDVPRVQPEPNAGKRPKASQRRGKQSKPPSALLPASAPAQIFHAAAAPACRLCPKLCRRDVLVRAPVSRGPCMGFV